MLFWPYNGVINRGGEFIIVRKSVNHVKVIVFSATKPRCSVLHCSWPILDTIMTSRRSGQYSIKWLHLVKTPDSMEVYKKKPMKVHFSAELSDNWIAAPEWSNPPGAEMSMCSSADSCVIRLNSKGELGSAVFKTMLLWCIAAPCVI